MIEELDRYSKDNHIYCNFVFLDAKAAFGVVNHSQRMRRLYHAGIRDKHLSLISSLHENATGFFKWMTQSQNPS